MHYSAIRVIVKSFQYHIKISLKKVRIIKCLEWQEIVVANQIKIDNLSTIVPQSDDRGVE